MLTKRAWNGDNNLGIRRFELRQMKFCNPFQGKPAPLDLAGLLQFSPLTVDRVDGIPLRKALGDLMGDARARHFIDMAKGKVPGTENDFLQLLAVLPESESGFFEQMSAALQGDATARGRLMALTTWELFLSGRGRDITELEPALAFVVDVEKAGAKAVQLIGQRKFKLAATELAEHPLLSRILCPESLAGFEVADTVPGLSLVRSAGAIESHLAWIAALDVHTSQANGWGRSLVVELLPTEARPGRNPAARYFDWLQREAGANSIQAFHESAKLVNSGVDMDLTTLKRWSAGMFQPDRQLLARIVHALFDEAGQQKAGFLDYCMRQLNFVGHFSHTILDRISKLEVKVPPARLRPWPNFPFGHASFEQWTQARYPYWLDFHNQQVERSGAA